MDKGNRQEKRQRLIAQATAKAEKKKKKSKERYRQKKAREEAGWKRCDQFSKLQKKLDKFNRL